MKPRLLALLLLITLISSYSLALDYKITSVIEVGEADFTPFIDPLIWSPDGTMLAFTKGRVIKISDTLGNVRDVIKLERAPHRYGWVSNNQIAVHMRRFTGNGPETVEELSLVNTSANSKSVIHGFTLERNYREIPGKTYSDGPYSTVEGNKYYRFTRFDSRDKNADKIERRPFIGNKSDALRNDHILRWNGDNLHKVRLDNSDSTWLAKRPASVLEVTGRTYINKDQSHVLISDGVINLIDSSFIDLQEFLKPFPPKTFGCGLVWFSFNPVATEILFTVACDDGHSYEVLRIGTFDYFTKDFRIIDILINIPNCKAPVYSPTGDRIAFLANGKAYIINRQVN